MTTDHQRHVNVGSGLSDYAGGLMDQRCRARTVMIYMRADWRNLDRAKDQEFQMGWPDKH
jgi:hypothetical protein